MASTLHFPGLAEYGSCKESFLRTKELIAQEPTPELRNELSALRAVLESNPDAVGFLEAQFGPEYARVYQRLTDAAMPLFLLDEHAADGGKKRLQHEWFDYWNTVTDGRVMASMGDLYKSFKVIKKMREGAAEEKSKAQSLLAGLQHDFNWSRKQNWLISSTRLIHSGNSLDTKIVQHYKCNQPELTKETGLEVPVHKGTPIEKIVSQKAGLEYMQALFDTQDDGDIIMQTIEFVSGKNRNSIVGWTTNINTSDTQYTRASRPERAAGFFYDHDLFLVYGSLINYFPGCSRGVRVGASVSMPKAPQCVLLEY